MTTSQGFRKWSLLSVLAIQCTASIFFQKTEHYLLNNSADLKFGIKLQKIFAHLLKVLYGVPGLHETWSGNY
jgi:predicted transglutaminase-like protease